MDIDFEAADFDPEALPLSAVYRVRAEGTGVVHAVLLTWECSGQPNGREGPTMNTFPGHATSFERDMNWGQGLQLVVDPDSYHEQTPRSFHVKTGEELEMQVRSTEDKAHLQIELLRWDSKRKRRCTKKQHV